VKDSTSAYAYGLTGFTNTERFDVIRLLLISTLLIGLYQQPAAAQTTRAADNAATLYLQAANLVEKNLDANIMCPASSNMILDPLSFNWMVMERVDFDVSAEVRTLAHEARSIDRADWPSSEPGKPDLRNLNAVRALTNDLIEAALYQHSQGDDAAAIETIRDVLHLARVVADADHKYLICLLVSDGIRAAAMDRLNTITASVTLTGDPKNHKALQVSTARELISQLLKHPAAADEVETYVKADNATVLVKNPGAEKSSIDKIIETGRRAYTECDLAAMSLACHVYKFDTGHWPGTLADLHGYLPKVPLDPWGDGKQTLGYALIKHGLPDGSDRPLVYCRFRMKDGFFFRTDQPFFSYYSSEGIPKDRKQGGQFRDVTAWVPLNAVRPAATQPLN
jgi:hypothetical protein